MDSENTGLQEAPEEQSASESSPPPPSSQNNNQEAAQQMRKRKKKQSEDESQKKYTKRAQQDENDKNGGSENEQVQESEKNRTRSGRRRQKEKHYKVLREIGDRREKVMSAIEKYERQVACPISDYAAELHHIRRTIGALEALKRCMEYADPFINEDLLRQRERFMITERMIKRRIMHARSLLSKCVQRLDDWYGGSD